MSGDVAGVYKVSLDGIDYRTKPGVSFDPGGEEGTSHYASGKRTGVSTRPIGSSIECVFELMADTDRRAIRKFKGPITVENDLGQVWNIANGSCIKSVTIKDDGGGIACRFEGDEAQEA